MHFFQFETFTESFSRFKIGNLSKESTRWQHMDCFYFAFHFKPCEIHILNPLVCISQCLDVQRLRSHQISSVAVNSQHDVIAISIIWIYSIVGHHFLATTGLVTSKHQSAQCDSIVPTSWYKCWTLWFSSLLSFIIRAQVVVYTITYILWY